MPTRESHSRPRGVHYSLRFGFATILFVFFFMSRLYNLYYYYYYYYYYNFSFHSECFISREMRPNGNLYFPPFPEQSYMPEIHAATYKCALENPVGRIVSRESRIKAGTDLRKYLIFVSAPHATAHYPYLYNIIMRTPVALIISFFIYPPPLGKVKSNDRSVFTFL